MPSKTKRKPVRLNILITMIFVMGVIYMLPTIRLFGDVKYALAVGVACFFTAHLCSMSHNSGRYCTIVLSLVLIGFSISDMIEVRNDFKYVEADIYREGISLAMIYAPILGVLVSFCMLILIFSKSVSEHFDWYMENE